ncbi:MAG: DivIVA domain-containing protein [Actinomycetota bacterium]
MPLSPQDIVRKEFREALRGYNQADVDLFLDEVVEEFTRISEDNQKMKVRIAALQQEVARLREGRGGTAPVAEAEDPQRIESEVRSRVRRFLEEQLRMIDSATPSPTVEKIAREAPQAPEPPAPSSPATERREPFWAGE